MNHPEIESTSVDLTRHDRIDHLQVRLGYRRTEHKVRPGLYRVGSPDRNSPVLVTANYSLSFDALRSSLKGLDCYIMVLDTKGVNVWCAAGKGTFGTEELVRQVRETELDKVVDHRRLVLPQLGAPGISAHEVKKATGFSVAYGPVRARNIGEYLRLGKATPEMRKVTFPFWDRAVLTPVELKQSLKYLLPALVLLYLVGGIEATAIALVAVIGGTVLFPLLLPHLPTREFSSKGLILGAALSLPFSYLHIAHQGTGGAWTTPLFVIAIALLMAPVVGYFALNFTGCSTYTSRTGVKKEIFRWVPVMVAMLIIGGVLMSISIAGQEGWF